MTNEEAVKELTDADQIASRVCRMLMEGMQPVPEFAPGSVPVVVAARVMGKAPDWIRAGIVNGWLPIGYAVKDGKLVTSLRDIKSDRKISYTIIPKKFWEVTGYVWKGEEKP